METKVEKTVDLLDNNIPIPVSIDNLSEEINKVDNNTIEVKPIKELIIDSIVSSSNFFLNNITRKINESEENINYKVKLKINDEYKNCIDNENIRPNRYNDKASFRSDTSGILDLNSSLDKSMLNKKGSRINSNIETSIQEFKDDIKLEQTTQLLNNIPEKYKINLEENKNDNLALSLFRNENHITFRKNKIAEPEWHAPWKLYRVISGHIGWVRCIDVDPTNNWFVTGSNDRVIKFWDLATGALKLSLTGHINTIRAVKVSPRHPYLFSAAEDKQVKCWDLEQNKVVRHYHGHLSGVYALAIHPTLDIIITGGRDCVARVWDMRSKKQIFCLEGHNNTISSIECQPYNPQVITGSHDSTVKLWDITAGKCMTTLTHHKKSIRSLAIHEEEFTFLSGKYFFIIF